MLERGGFGGGGGFGGDSLYVTLYAGGCEGWSVFARDVEVPEVTRCVLSVCWRCRRSCAVLFCMLEAVKGGLCLLGMRTYQR